MLFRATFRAAAVSLWGLGGIVMASNFIGHDLQVNYGIATHGNAIAYLIDSPGNDTFVGNMTESYLSGSDDTCLRKS